MTRAHHYSDRYHDNLTGENTRYLFCFYQVTMQAQVTATLPCSIVPQPVRIPLFRATWCLEWDSYEERITVLTLMRILGTRWRDPDMRREQFERAVGEMLKVILDLRMVSFLRFCFEFFCFLERIRAFANTIRDHPRSNLGTSQSCS